MKRRLAVSVPGPGELRIGSAVFDSRPATAREKRQLRALAKHRRKQLALVGRQP